MKKARIVAIILLAATAAAIFYLTSQNPEQTISLTQRAISKLPEFLIQPRNSDGNIILPARRMAHIYQFALMGTFSGFIMFTFEHPNIILRTLIAAAICAAYSLFDQLHKLFVPGREFDTFDLKLDAAGYITSIIIMMIICSIVRRFKNQVKKAKTNKA